MRKILCLLSIVCVLPLAHAEKADRERPTNIEADQMFYDDLKQINFFQGNVLLTRGTLTIRGAQLSTRQDAQGYQSGTALGSPAVMRQKNEGTADTYTEASGAKIDYDERTQRVKIIGNASLKKFEGVKVVEDVRGHVIVYDESSENYTVESSKAGATTNHPQGRVRVVIQPKNETAPKTPSTGARATATLEPALKLSPGVKTLRPE